MVTHCRHCAPKAERISHCWAATGLSPLERTGSSLEMSLSRCRIRACSRTDWPIRSFRARRQRGGIEDRARRFRRRQPHAGLFLQGLFRRDLALGHKRGWTRSHEAIVHQPCGEGAHAFTWHRSAKPAATTIFDSSASVAGPRYAAVSSTRFIPSAEKCAKVLPSRRNYVRKSTGSPFFTKGDIRVHASPPCCTSCVWCPERRRRNMVRACRGKSSAERRQARRSPSVKVNAVDESKKSRREGGSEVSTGRRQTEWTGATRHPENWIPHL